MSTADHAFQTDEARLEPIAQKVVAGERLSAEEALALYGSHDILAVGWMANHVPERRWRFDRLLKNAPKQPARRQRMWDLPHQVTTDGVLVCSKFCFSAAG